MLNVDATVLNRINAKLMDYYRVLGKLTIPQVLDKKGNDLRIQVGKLFQEVKFGGLKGMRKNRSIALRETRKRAKSGKGTFVRNKTLDSKWGPHPDVSDGRKVKGRKLTLWQKLVWQENERRTSGIGVLGAGFFSKRFRYRKSGERFLAENRSKTFGTMVSIKQDGGSFIISGFTPGLVEISNRYNIANRALLEVERDMDVYLNRKFNEARQKVFAN